LLDVVKTLTVSEAVAEKLLNQISKGKLAWGQKLPSQRKLAKILNVGTSSLREGLQILQATGFIEIKRGQGTYITENSSIPLSKNIILSLNIDSDVRNIKKMTTYLENYEKFLGKDNLKASEYDLKFHLALVESVGNPLIYKISLAIRTSLEEFIENIEHTRKGLTNHWRVLEAVKERDTVKARDAMKTLLKLTERTYFKTRSKIDKEKKHG
jgi:GntR family transcriptional repressor for pyruvate dehydrogenase complex